MSSALGEDVVDSLYAAGLDVGEENFHGFLDGGGGEGAEVGDGFFGVAGGGGVDGGFGLEVGFVGWGCGGYGVENVFGDFC